MNKSRPHSSLPKVRVLDIMDVPGGVTAEELEAKLNEPCDAGYYLDRYLCSPANAPEGVAVRAFFKLRAKPEA